MAGEQDCRPEGGNFTKTPLRAYGILLLFVAIALGITELLPHWLQLAGIFLAFSGVLSIAYFGTTSREQIVLAEAESAKERLERVLSSINDGFYVLDQNWRFIFVNDRYCEIVGMSYSELLGRNIWELFPSAVETEAYYQFHQAMREQTPLQFDYLYAPWNCWHEHRIYPSPTSLTVLLTDISDRVRAEVELQASEERFRNLADNTPMMVWVTDPTGYCTYLSRSWYEFSGQTEAAALGFGWLDIAHPEDQAISKQIFLRANERQEAFQLEYRLRRKDGVYRTCIDAARPWFGAEGEFKGYIGSVVDIDDRKRAEIALRQSEERYRTLFNSIDEGFCIVEILVNENNQPIDYRFLEVNSIFEEQTGLQQPVGKTALELVPGLENRWVEIYGRVALTGESVRFEDGSAPMNRWFDVYACRLGQPEERKVAIVFKDMSDRKRIEREREQLLVREQAAREAAERANRLKDEFLAVLSHELRTPLNPILGWSKLLQSGKLNVARTAEAMATIERNAQLQSQLIDDLLDISRIMQGKLTLNASPVDFASVITAAIATVRLAADAKKISISTSLQPNLNPVHGDAGRLQQIVWNLLSNAVKFTPSGGRIEVRLVQIEHHLELQVIDTGKGISSEFLPYVFEHFRQEDGATTRKFGGLGLGLAIARQIVELHGGTIAVDSLGEGKGTTFTVWLPVMNYPIQSPSPKSADSLGFDLSEVQILVIDDEADSRNFVAFVLEEAGAIVTSAASGSEALQAIEKFLPDLIVSDIGMPEMDGYMLLQQVRNLPSASSIPAIALTAYAGEIDQQQALNAGFQKHLAKPIDPDLLLMTVISLRKTHEIV